MIVLKAYEDDPADDENPSPVRSTKLSSGWSWRAVSAENALRIVKRFRHPRAVMMNGERLPASYANFYIANGVVIVPTFNDRNDRIALNQLAELFPDREVPWAFMPSI